MSNIVTLKSFPFDSMEKLNEESGQMEDDRLYEAEIFRKYFAKFLSNGVYYGHYKNYGENSMKVSLDSGLTIKVAKGAGIIEGADYELEETSYFTLERPESGNRIDRVVVKLDKTLAIRETQLYVKKGNGTTPATLQRDDNIYEICIAEVTVKSGSNITTADIKDTRLNKSLCGIVDSLISVDGKELYEQFQAYIDAVTNNLVRKDQDSTINGNIVANSVKDKNNKILSTNDFTNAYKQKLDGIESGATNTKVYSGLDYNKITNNMALNAYYGYQLNKYINSLRDTDNFIITNIRSLETKIENNKMSVDEIISSLNNTDKSIITDIRSLETEIESNRNSADQAINQAISKIDNLNKVKGNFTVEGSLFVDNEAIRSQHTYNKDTVTNSPNLYITSNGWIRRTTNTSSKRYKKDIKKLTDENLNPEKLYDLEVKQFKYKDKYQPNENDPRYNQNLIGFIAEDVAKIFPIAVDYEIDKEGNAIVENWNERYMIPAMLKLIQELHKEIEELKRKG